MRLGPLRAALAPCGPRRRLPRSLPPLLALLAQFFAGSSPAADWELSLDARLVNSDAARPFTEGGLGMVRYGSNEDGVQLGRARFALSEPLGELWSAHLDASMYDDRGRSPVGLTEAYLLFRPYPRGGYRFRLKAGGFYPPLSLENRAAGWDSPYTLSFSAIDTWLATEVRTIGVEATLDWLGTRTGHSFDLGFTGGVFGWNEQAGVVLASDGFTLSDRQTPLFDHVGPPGSAPLYGAQPFLQLDRRVGEYGGLEARYFDRVVLRLLRYDNRADPTQIDNVSGAIGWNTHFNSAGVRLEAEHGWTAIAQYLEGETSIAPQGMQLAWPFRAQYALLARRSGRHTLSARYDRFEVDSRTPDGDGAQSGHAWTAAYLFDASAHWRVALEWLRVTGSSYGRHDLGGPWLATETQLQLALRYTLSSAGR